MQEDVDRIDGERRARALRAAQDGEDGGDVEADGEGERKPTTFMYRPPAYTTY